MTFDKINNKKFLQKIIKTKFVLAQASMIGC